MAPDALESRNVTLRGFHDLSGRPPFKIAIREVGDRILLYCAHFFYSGWSVVDVTDPGDPTLEAFVPGPDNTMTKNIQVADDLMLVGLERPSPGYGPVSDPMDPADHYEEGAYLFDVSDPTEPDLRSHYRTGGAGTHRNFYTGGDHAYLVAWPDDYEKGMLVVLDVSDPDAPAEVGRWWWPGQGPGEEADEDFYFHGPAYVDGDRAHLSYGRVGAVTLDVSDPASPELVTRLPISPGLGSRLGVHSFVPVPGSDLAVVNTEAISEASPLAGGEPLNFTVLVDVGDEREPGFDEAGRAVGPTVVSSVPLPTPGDDLPYDTYYEKGGRFGPHNQHHPGEAGPRLVTDDLLFMTYFNAGLRVFDISTPLAPAEVGHYVPEDPARRIGSRPSSALVSHFEDVVVDSRGFVYCSDANHGLFVLETDLV